MYLNDKIKEKENFMNYHLFYDQLYGFQHLFIKIKNKLKLNYQY